MAHIYIETRIEAPRQLVFDLSRSIDLHQESTQHTQERAIAGKTSGLIGLHETVTWRARHLGVYQQLTTKITAMKAPSYFEDIMTKGIFKYMRHRHFFEETGSGTLMIDQFLFAAPFGCIGRLFDRLFLNDYLKRLLLRRNQLIKTRAESLHQANPLKYPQQ